MESNFRDYNYLDSINRMDEIIASEDKSYEELNTIPSRDKLTFSNGFWVYTSVIYVDIRESSTLVKNNSYKQMARLYRVYISEVIAILNGFIECNEIYIEGDGVWAIFNTPKKYNIDNLFEASAKICSLIDIINTKYKIMNLPYFNIGVGLHYGRALMIKAGYKGSAINDVVWTGDAVSKAVELCNYGSKTYSDYRVMISDVFYNNLKDDYKKLCKWNSLRQCYHAYIIDIEMNKWLSNHQ